VICLAAGIGITPFVSAFRAIAASTRAPEFMLHQVAASKESAVFHQELARIAASKVGLSFTLWLRRGELPAGDHVRGGGDAVLIAGAIDENVLARRPLVYLCGPQSFMDAIRGTLLARGVPTSDIIEEAFKSTLPLPKSIMPARVFLKRSGTSFVWSPESGSLLSSATAAGVSLPSGCQVGQCESCAVPVVSGRFLTSVTTELGPRMCLTCQSIPLGELTLDA
jgi:ferredoxin-NADP reductase